MADNDDAASILTSVPSIRSSISMETITPTQTAVEAAGAVEADLPPPYSAHDPNSLSMPSLDGSESRRRLLLVFMHGFLGNESSFQDFPAHVHSLISVLLRSSHVVQTKIYPRYQSRSAIQVAAHNFSNWLNPHEGPETDVILVGHSMGGILAAEVTLLPSSSPSSPSPFKHRILGTINFDSPFLGMHHGVIKSGLNSIFRPDLSPPRTPNPQTPESASRQNSGLTNSQLQDPHFNPAFPNDVRLPLRSGWRNAQHFVTKHARHLGSATQKLITSHAEFSGCLADFEGLKIRYSKIRSLEDEDPEKREAMFQDQKPIPRVRFVNYYTASTGKPKRSNSIPQTSMETVAPATQSYPTDTKIPIAEPLTTAKVGEISNNPNPTLEEELSDDGSDLSDLTDLETLDGTESVLSDAPTAVSDSEYVPPKGMVRENTGASSSSTITTNTKHSYDFLPEPAFVADSTNNFATLFKQHHRMIKDRVAHFKAQQKIEYQGLIRDFKNAPKANKAHIKAFIQTQRAERDRFYEQVKGDWKEMYEQLKKDLDIKTVEQKKRQDLSKISEKQARSNEKVERKLERLERKSERNERKANRRVEKIDRRFQKQAAKQGHEVESDEPPAVIEELFSAEDSTADPQETPYRLSPTSTGTSDTLNSSRTTLPPYSAGSQIPPATPAASSASNLAPYAGPVIPVKDKKFCVLPAKNQLGHRDAAWVRVFMKDLDEVGAHCGLFFPMGPGEEVQQNSWSERYSWLVRDTAERVEQWVKDGAL